MANRIVLTLIFIFCTVGCKKEALPKDVLTEPEMVNLLIEMYLAEERIAKVSVPFDSTTKLIPFFREKVYADVGITDSVYLKSMEYYMARPRQLEHIYTAVVDSLSLRLQSIPNENVYDPTQ